MAEFNDVGEATRKAQHAIVELMNAALEREDRINSAIRYCDDFLAGDASSPCSASIEELKRILEGR